MEHVIYLDHAAATPLDDQVLEAMVPYMADAFYNPSSPYAPAVEVRKAYEEAKRRIAQLMGAKPQDIIMCAGATESINIAFASVSGHVVVPAIEHESVLACAGMREHTEVAVDASGIVKASDIVAAIREDTQLISVARANNELGTLQPIREITSAVKNLRKERLISGNTTPLYVHCDASQGVGLIDVNVSSLGVDMLTLNAAKMYGPKQVGLLWTAKEVALHPFIVGGGQERSIRCGTENVAGTIGFAKAFELAASQRADEVQRLKKLRDKMQSELRHLFPEAVFLGSQKKRLPNYLHVSFPGIDAERLIFQLEAEGVLVASGSACAANKETRSHVLEAIGVSEEIADGSLRITLGHLSTEENIEQAIGILKQTVKED